MTEENKIIIKLLLISKVFTIKVNVDTKTVRDLKNKIPKFCPEVDFKGKWIRLLYRGKFLEDHLSLKSTKLEDGDSMQCILSDKKPPESYGRKNKNRLKPIIEEEFYEPKGFDRLSESGFSEEEIEEMRTQFYRNKKELIDSINEGKITDEQLYEMEDEWINDENNQTTNLEEEENENMQGDLYDMFFGLVFGFFLSFISLIFMLERGTSSKMRYGILSGLLINFAFSIVRMSLPFLKYFAKIPTNTDIMEDMSDEEKRVVTRRESEYTKNIKTCYKGLLSEKPEDQFSSVQELRKILSTEKNPPIDEVIDCGCVPLFVKFLKDFNRPQIQFESAWALTNIASGTSENTETVVNSGAVTSFIELLIKSTDEDVIEQSIWCLGNIAGDSVEYRDALLQAEMLNGISNIITTITKINILRNATWCLSNLCRGKPSPSFKVVQPAVPILCALLYHQDVDILTDALWALSYISDGSNEPIDAVIQQGAIPILISLMMHTTVVVVTPALRTIGNIVTGTDRQTDVFVQCGGVPVVAKLLQHTHKTIRKEAAWTISNITAGVKEQIQVVLDCGILELLLAMVKNDSPDIVTEALWAISNATAGGTNDQIQYMVKSGVLEVYAEALQSKDSRIQTVICEGLENIFSKDSKYAEMFESVGGVDSLEDVSDSNDKALEILSMNFGELEIE
eukprot:gene6383-10390_t